MFYSVLLFWKLLWNDQTGRILLDESFLLGDQSDSKSIAGCNGKGGRFCRDHICGSRKEGFHADDDTGQ